MAFLQGRFPKKPYLQVGDGSIPQVVWHLGEVELDLATSRGGVITVHLVGDGVGCPSPPPPPDHSVDDWVDSAVEVMRRFVYGGPRRHVLDPGVIHHCRFRFDGDC